MKNQAYRMALLYDFYGDTLTPRQKEFFDLYYNEDLSLAEIAENYDITRQGVRDVIVRAEGILTDLEDKTGIVRRFKKMQEQLSEIEASADGIIEFNTLRNGRDSVIDGLCQQIKNTVAIMKQE
ncbi:MAG: YlxM family DNA-binding protein [Pseudoflavonifractor sp.]